MKLSYRDKVILIVLLVILVWVIGVMFFIKPKFEELDDANKEFDNQVLVLENKKNEIKADEGLEDRVREAYNEVTNITKNFYDKMTTEEVSETIDNILDEDEITNDSLSISAYGTATIDLVNSIPQDMQTEVDIIASQNANLGVTPVENSEEITSEETVQGPATVPAYSVSFGFSCTMEQLQSFLDKLLTRNEKSLVVTSCTISDVNEETISGSMDMTLMMMPRLQNPLDKQAAAS
ncbi:MAG: hypothetical protein IKP47_05170 [Ruminococcus sp.]|nr:hypothetical protein [Ruminococcus sp.]